MGNTSSSNNMILPFYTAVTSSNPYATARVSGTGSYYKLNDFLTNQNSTIEQAVPVLYERLMNPTINDPVSLARRQAFTNAFNIQAQNAFENNLINPLSERRMLRSSLLNDITNNLQARQTEQVPKFNNNLLANSIDDTQSLINFYMNQYKNNASFGENTLKNTLSHSSNVNSYYGNMVSKALSKIGSSSSSSDFLDYASDIIPIVMAILSFI